jgi:segregation and condensation protein B
MILTKVQTKMTPSLEALTMDDDLIEDEAEPELPEAVGNEPAVDSSPMMVLDDPAQQKRVIEALLFASPEPVSLRSIQSRLPASADVGGMLLELQTEYAGRGVQLVRLEDVWAFRTAEDIGPYLALAKKEEKKLSRAALETLSIIAYHQPVTRAEVENIRGVATNKGTLDVLLEAGWIKPGRRRETPGRPVTWMTTNTFLDEFGVSSLSDLPGVQELRASGLLDTRPAIDTIPGAADLFGANENGAEEKSEEATPADDEVLDIITQIDSDEEEENL